MATKAEMLADPNSCWNKARDDEQVFVLRGKDATAPPTIRTWCEINAFNTAMPPEKLKRARLTALAMEQNPKRRFPD